MQPILKRKAAVPEIQSVDQAVAFLCVLNQMMLGSRGQKSSCKQACIGFLIF